MESFIAHAIEPSSTPIQTQSIVSTCLTPNTHTWSAGGYENCQMVLVSAYLTKEGSAMISGLAYRDGTIYTSALSLMMMRSVLLDITLALSGVVSCSTHDGGGGYVTCSHCIIVGFP